MWPGNVSHKRSFLWEETVTDTTDNMASKSTIWLYCHTLIACQEVVNSGIILGS